ncbi:multiple coagulation factor deficiency protein 2 homolog isoform X3 [Haliotis rubra]|uniref:multiple coagulation factor deficiency protein 2 homolog isoform X3 n=1 Tax=Haliotis rubra TaxID=36100 RepID=UPI001EE614E4|nr:multiple coagulation factor deficiency protein 2 homolog isoform X3 [Haliotis rubra]
MKILFLLAFLAATANAHMNEQRFAPGVPPPQQQQQHHQQQPPQQQQQYQQQPPQQQQQQYQQPPQQEQQQVNQMNQQQVPPPQGGAQPVHGGHGHGHGDTMKFSSDIHNAEHVMEHLENVIETKPKDQMTEEELEFHYFKMHDYDNNNKLDGVEIGKALTHYHAEQSSKDSSAPPPEVKVFTDDEISNIVDVVLKENDMNGDGYIEYAEFKRAQDKEKQKPPPPTQPPQQ